MAKKLALLLGHLMPKGGEGDEPDEDESGGGDPMKDAMEQFISAVKSGDAEMASEAFKACFEHCESEPHEEGEHEPAE